MQRIILSLIICLLMMAAGLSFFWKPDPIHIYFATNDTYAPHVATSILSIIQNSNPTDKLHIYILESGLSDQNKYKIHSLKKRSLAKIEFVHMDKKMFETLSTLHVPQESYYRYVIPRLKNHTKALYLDSDIIVLESLRELWNTDISNSYLAAVKDPKDPGHLGVPCYFNAGILLLNTKKIKEDGMIEKMFQKTQEMTDNGSLWLEDQDVLNILFNNKFKILDDKFNYPGYRDMNKKVTIIHYLVKKPWKFTMSNSDQYWKYRNQTAYILSTEEINKLPDNFGDP